MEKIKTIGGAFIAAAGVPTPCDDHAQRVAELALRMQTAIASFDGPNDTPLRLKIGMSSGSLIAGVIGRSRLSYDLWGQTVDTASTMTSHGIPGAIQISQSTRDRLGERYLYDERGTFFLESGEEITTYLLRGRKPPAC